LEFVFDSDPVAVKQSNDSEEVTNNKRMNALIKGFTAVKDHTNTFLAYFTPNILESELPNEFENVEYEWIREYSFRLSPEEVQYFFVRKNDKIEYCELKNKILMNKISKSSNEDVGKIILKPSTEIPEFYKSQRDEEIKRIEINE